MQTNTKALHFDIHDRAMIRDDAEAPAAAQLRSMLACFSTGTGRPVVVLRRVTRDAR